MTAHFIALVTLVAVWTTGLCENDTTIDEVILSAMMASQNATKSTNPEDLFSRAASSPQGGTVLVDLDMEFTTDQWAEILKAKREEENAPPLSRKKRKAIRSIGYRWTNNVVPYTLARGHFSARDRGVINTAIVDWMKYTCLRFRPATSGDRNRIYFQNGRGCSSHIGMLRNQRSQSVNLAPNCRYKSVVIHELGHAVGMMHEQTRPDRDPWVTIHAGNVIPGMLYNFNKFPASSTNYYGVPYDYLSIMHYGQTAFSRNGRRTITTRKSKYQHQIGRSSGLSFRDIKIGNRMYSCAKACTTAGCPGEGFRDKNCVCQCPGNPIRPCTGTVKPTPTGTCVDQKPSCEAWKNKGYCQGTHGPYMAVNCKKACGVCGPKVTTKATTKVTQPGTCENKHRDCEGWKKIGYCQGKYERSMAENCKKACGTCGSKVTTKVTKPATVTTKVTVTPNPTVAPGTCGNKNKDCEAWKNKGYCQGKYARYMAVTCRKACGTCGSKVTKPAPTCVNTNANCGTWARLGYCNWPSYRAYMSTKCKSACNLCATVGAPCLDGNQYCGSWTAGGECQRNPNYMHRVCKKSCKICTEQP